MTPSPVIAVHDGIGVFRLVAECRFPKAVAMIVEVIAQTRLRGIDRLLIDIRGLTGFDPPSMSERHAMVREFAIAAGGIVRGAMIVRPPFLDPERFGVIAAANFGLVSNAFSSEDEALDWLRQLPD